MTDLTGAARPAAYASPLELVLRAIGFGLLVLAAVAAVITAGEWWTAGLALAGKAAAAAGLVVSVLALLDDGHARSWRSDRAVAAGLAILAVALIGLALGLA
jgi:hypothetical protein